MLVGGGHTHVQVLRKFGMQPPQGLRVTLVAREIHTPYSGMLPGYIAGHYQWRDLHIDLGPLAQFAGVRLLQAEVEAIDLRNRQLQLSGRPALRFDSLSINSGAVPQAVNGTQAQVTEGSDQPLPVKPIGQFLPRWQQLLSTWQPARSLLLLGLGAGAIELAFAIRQKLGPSASISLLGDRLLPGSGIMAVRRVRQLLAQHQIKLVDQQRIVQAGAQEVTTESGQTFSAHHILDVTSVQAPSWLAASGLLVDEGGFVRVDAHLRSLSHPFVFAAGDAASLEGQPRPKSGVYAVRAGPVLAHNLRHQFAGVALRRFRAQPQALALLGTGHGQALAMRGSLALGGGPGSGLWWRYKRWIDQRFIARFNQLPDMAVTQPALPLALQAEALDPMRCGGCGAKLAAAPLQRVLTRLPAQTGAQIKLGIGDDAALIGASSFDQLLTVDGFGQFVDDPYLFGRITAHHCLNDILAMGGRPRTALALATVPPMGTALMEDELYQLLLGAVEVLNANGCQLVGGHSAEGPQLSLGLTITGDMQGDPLTKGGALPGMSLLLTKPVGTGVLLAGAMRGVVPSDQLPAVYASMDLSNAAAVDILRQHQVAALTDVTGFGLLGHLGEMLRASGQGVRLHTGRVPVFAGALPQLQAGVHSSLQLGNLAAAIEYGVDVQQLGERAKALVDVLVDPQTSGGLLAAVPLAQTDSCIAALIAAGYTASTNIGEIITGPSELLGLNNGSAG